MYFVNPKYDINLRTFTGEINFGENTLKDISKRTYSLVFSEDLLKIESGFLKGYNILNEIIENFDYGKN